MSFMVTTSQVVDTHTQKKKESKHNIKDSHQIIKKESKRRKEERINTKTTPKQLAKQPLSPYVPIIKFKWTKYLIERQCG